MMEGFMKVIYKPRYLIWETSNVNYDPKTGKILSVSTSYQTNCDLVDCTVQSDKLSDVDHSDQPEGKQ